MRRPLSVYLPPLIMGTATFNHQFNHDPYALPTTHLVHKALSNGITAFDTSPYYGPAEELLGQALSTAPAPRHAYTLLTKVGRIASSAFDYSPEWIRHSVRRSLARLHTSYLDVVYCHDVEFVSPEDVVAAVRELRRIRDESPNPDSPVIRYVGISGYPVDTLGMLAELVLRETGEPVDVVLSYANFTVQNERLAGGASAGVTTTASSQEQEHEQEQEQEQGQEGLERMRNAGVDVVLNASPLGMGLVRSQGVPVGAMGDFHPAPAGLREVVRNTATWVQENANGERLEVVAIRYALEEWARQGARAGVAVGGVRLGGSVMGVSTVGELEETLRVWNSILDGLDGLEGFHRARDQDREWSAQRRLEILGLVDGVRRILGDWVDYVWDSPGSGFVNTLPDSHLEERKLISSSTG